jgi:hypothetical protein
MDNTAPSEVYTNTRFFRVRFALHKPLHFRNET